MDTAQSKVVDLGDEVIRFAHAQGHTKASKSTINWKGLKTESERVRFTETSTKRDSRPCDSWDSITDLLHVSELNQRDEALTCNKTSTTSCSEPVQFDRNRSEPVQFDRNRLFNAEHTEKRYSIRPKSKNNATASIRFSTTLICSKNNKNGKQKTNTMNNTIKTAKNQILSKVRLEPKFSSEISLKTGWKKLPVAAKESQQVVVTIPSKWKALIEVTEQTEKETGHFEVDYHLWGFVEVTVWGKPYNLMVTDILDTKNNSLFTRESLTTISSDDEVYVSTITLTGVYERVIVYHEIKVKLFDPAMPQQRLDMEKYSCLCHTMPRKLNVDDLLPLCNKNLAKLLFHLRKTFRQNGYRDRDTYARLWLHLLQSGTRLGKVAHNVNSEQSMKTFCSLDKLAIALLLWRSGVEALNDLESFASGTENELKQSTLLLINELQTIDIPTHVICFLWTKNESTKPVSCTKCSRGEKDKFLSLQHVNEAIRTKLMATLPDRVLVRLLQRWPDHHGWIAAALHLQIDVGNVHSLICNNKTTITIGEKRMTVFKLWRMKNRRERQELRSNAETAGCTTWDLCTELHAMQMPLSIYNFIWKDAETTP